MHSTMCEDEDSDIQVPGAYSDSPTQESWSPLSYLAGLFPRLSTFVSLNLLAFNVDASHGSHFQGPVNGFINNAENGGQAIAHSAHETSMQRATPRSVFESTPNSRADFEIYYDQLLLRKRGSPLYLPGPLGNLPIEYRRTGCRIGDIGVLYSNGFFDYYFNILFPAYHPINRGRVPQGFKHFDFAPAVTRRDIAVGQAFTPCSFLASAWMRKRNSPDDGPVDMDFIFETTESESEGAVLVLPGGSKFQDLLSRGCLKNYIAKHADQWYSYIRGTCGRLGVGNGDVRLVIGFDKAHSWGIATFECSQQPGHFGFKKPTLSGSFAYTWYCPAGIGNGKSGPLDDEIQDLRQPTDDAPPENQTIFIRTMNFALRGEIRDDPDSVALQVRPNRSRTQGPRNSALFQGNSSRRQASSTNQPSGAWGPQVGQQRGVNFLPTHYELPTYLKLDILEVVHPSTYLNLFLLDKFPHANIAITDDWDWISIIHEDDSVFPTSTDLCQRILDSFQVSEENGIATILTPNASIGDASPTQDHTPVDILAEPIWRDEALSTLRVHCALSALVNSVERIPPPRCAPSTRQAVTMKIEKWAKNSSSDTSKIFWLTGGVGAGKSAVTQSVAEVCKQDNLLAASFFFSGASNLTNNGASLIPTLVFQLVEVLPGLKPLVEDCINSHRDLFSDLWDIQKVAQELFIEPLKILHLTEPDHVCPPLVVIDGLDECHDSEFQCELLRIIAKAILEVPCPFRLLIASRPEDHLVKSFADLQMITVHRYNLSDDSDADCDIHHFLEQQLEQIRRTHPFRAQLPAMWPGEEVLSTLVDTSSQHFLYASTVIEYIQSPKHRPEERLSVILGLSPPATKLDRPFLQLDFLYFSMFQTLGKGHLQELHSVLGLRRVLDDSSSANDGFFQWQSGSEFLFFSSSPESGYRTPLYIIETLLKIRPVDVKFILSPLRSLVSIDNCDVRVLHKSLFDYLLDSSRSGDFHLNLSIPHRMVTKYIIENWVLFQNYPFAGPTQFTNETRDDILAYHLKASGLDTELNSFFSDHPIGPPPAYHSIGSPTFNSRVPLPSYHSIPDPSPASQKIQKYVNPKFFPVLRRSISFLLKTKHPNSRATYTLPDRPFVTSETEHDNQAWSIEYNSDTRPGLDMTLVRTFMHGVRVFAVRFSPDGYYLGVGLGTESLDKGKVCIYDVGTGTIICLLVKHLESTQSGKVKTAIRSVCFSPDSRFCVIGDSMGIIKVWVLARKRIRSSFVGHTSAVTSLDFSPNGQLLASASLDGSIRIWRIRDGFSKVLTQNADYFYSIKFSPNGKYVATTNIDKTLRIWHVPTSRLVDWWIGNTAAVDSIAFTPSGLGLVGGSWDRTLRYWDLSSLEWGLEASADRRHEILKFKGHNDRVFSVAISPDGRWVLSGSRDGSTSLWDIYDGTRQCTLQGHKGAIRSVDFSPAGNYLAVGSNDGRVMLWKYGRI